MNGYEAYSAAKQGKRIRGIDWNVGEWIIGDPFGSFIFFDQNGAIKPLTSRSWLETTWELFEEEYTGLEYSNDGEHWLRFYKPFLPLDSSYRYKRNLIDGIPAPENPIPLTPEMIGKVVRLRNGDLDTILSWSKVENTFESYWWIWGADGRCNNGIGDKRDIVEIVR